MRRVEQLLEDCSPRNVTQRERCHASVGFFLSLFLAGLGVTGNAVASLGIMIGHFFCKYP